MSDIKYIKSLQANKEISKQYYLKSITKTYQQKFLEEKILSTILKELKEEPKIILDIACGAGTLTYHISKIFSKSKFILIDLNPEAIEIAKKINANLENVDYLVEDFNSTSIPENFSDLSLCIQTILSISKPKKFIEQIIRVTKKDKYFILSGLFNLEHDVDIYCKVRDLTRKNKTKLIYNTFSYETISRWIASKVQHFNIIPFDLPEPLPKESRGLGSYTIKTHDNRYLTISGGMLLQWGFLVGKK
ncbi:MAG: class I SAM-dependent methyltransferase [Candidatus Calescibacterium sp.]|nr:class I SAM-dependent methyltransferase [Candidatus Calescibacterium sp.]MDW8133001.1 class I SAM-dependent methyltransferase [Candidatus Calescibacterium sp.]